MLSSLSQKKKKKKNLKHAKINLKQTKHTNNEIELNRNKENQIWMPKRYKAANATKTVENGQLWCKLNKQTQNECKIYQFFNIF